MDNIRNQTWDSKGNLLRDIELYLEDGALTAKDRLTGLIRYPTEAETKQFFYKQPETTNEKISKLDARIKDLEKK